jgi:hypothetical protein
VQVHVVAFWQVVVALEVAEDHVVGLHEVLQP